MNIDELWDKYSTAIAFGSQIFKDGIYKNEYMTKKSFTEAIAEIISSPVEPEVSDDCELQGRLKENQMYYNSMTDFYYSDMNKDEDTLWLKIRDLFERRIEDLEEQIASNSR